MRAESFSKGKSQQVKSFFLFERIYGELESRAGVHDM